MRYSGIKSLNSSFWFIRVISGVFCLVVFSWLEYLGFAFLVSGGFGANPPALELVFFSEWLSFGAASAFFAYRPPSFGSAGVNLTFAVGYIAIAAANFTFMFAGGTCVDLHGNIYSEANMLLQKEGFLSDVSFTPPSGRYLCVKQVL
ncbi:hypothetical protein [Bradyrhizobium sp. USDA 329]|uniref:hypothetical protein n=1 Tax=unclassified Bradyrhizobium TaxID=2631580 RepID=UPI003516DC22